LVDRVLNPGVVAASGYVDLLIRLGRPQRLLKIVLVSLGDPQSRLLRQSVRRITDHKVVPDRDRLFIILPLRQFLRDVPKHLRHRPDFGMIVILIGYLQQLGGGSHILASGQSSAEGVDDPCLG